MTHASGSAATAQVQCPACGSHDVETRHGSRTYTPPYGTTISFPIEVDTCRACGESGDFRGGGDAVIESAIEQANRRSVEAMIDSLGDAGISMAYLERALGLPTRTVARWKSGGCSASGTALLRIIRTFPWILDVAAAQFAAPVTRRALLNAAGEVIEQATTEAAPADPSQQQSSEERPERMAEKTKQPKQRSKRGGQHRGV